MTRKTLALSAAALALAAGFLPGVALAQGKVLKFVSWQKDERGVGDWWGSVIKEFEATHPGVKIEWTKVERGAYADTMTTLFAGESRRTSSTSPPSSSRNSPIMAGWSRSIPTSRMRNSTSKDGPGRTPAAGTSRPSAR